MCLAHNRVEPDVVRSGDIIGPPAEKRVRQRKHSKHILVSVLLKTTELLIRLCHSSKRLMANEHSKAVNQRYHTNRINSRDMF